MANALTLEAPPAMFDELASILNACGCTFMLVSSESEIRGIRRKDFVHFSVVDDSATVDLWAERRLGNQSIFISLIPAPKSIWRHSLSSVQLAERIAEWLVERGARAD